MSRTVLANIRDPFGISLLEPSASSVATMRHGLDYVWESDSNSNGPWNGIRDENVYLNKVLRLYINIYWIKPFLYKLCKSITTLVFLPGLVLLVALQFDYKLNNKILTTNFSHKRSLNIVKWPTSFIINILLLYKLL